MSTINNTYRAYTSEETALNSQILNLIHDGNYDEIYDSYNIDQLYDSMIDRLIEYEEDSPRNYAILDSLVESWHRRQYLRKLTDELIDSSIDVNKKSLNDQVHVELIEEVYEDINRIYCENPFVDKTNKQKPELNPKAECFEPKRNNLINRLQKVGLYDRLVAKPQSGIEVNHNITWKPLDRVVNGVCDMFSSSKSEFETARTHLTEGPNGDKSIFGIFSSIIEYIGSDNRLETVLIMSSILFIGRKNKFSMYLFYISLSLYVIKIMLNTNLEPTIETMGVYNLWEKLSESVSKQDKDIVMEEIVPHGIEESLPLVSTVSLGVLSSMAGMTAKKNLFDTLLNVTKISETQTKNVGALIVILCGGLHAFFSNIKQEHLADYFYIDSVVDREAHKFVERVIAFTSAMETGCPASETYHAEAYSVLMIQGDNLLKRLDKKSYDYTSVTDSMKQLRNENARVAKLKASLNGTRVEPVGILIKGAPGVAKSILSNRLMKAVTRATIPKIWLEDFEEDPKSFFYSLPKDKFFDGYTNKAWATLCDDIYQTREAVNMPDSDSLRTINMINIAPYTLPMANVNAKNNTYFRSPFVFATTNLPDFSHLQSVMDFRAVERRWHITLSAKANPRYCNAKGEVDPVLLPLYPYTTESGYVDDGTVIPDDFWILDAKIKTANSTIDKPNISIEEAAVMIIYSHHEKIKNFYINSAAEKHFGDSLDAKLSKIMANETFSHEMYKTFNPQAGDWHHTWSEFRQKCSNNPQQSAVIASLYYDMCNKFKSESTGYGRIDLYHAGTEAIDKHLNALDFIEKSELEALLPVSGERTRETIKPFFDALFFSYERWIYRGINPVTGYPVNKTKVSNITTFWIKIKNIFRNLIDFITQHKLTLLACSAILAAGVYWFGGFLCETVSVDPQGSQDQGRMMHGVGRPVPGRLSQGKHLINTNPQGFDLNALNFDSLPKLTASDFGVQNNSTDVIAKIFNKYFYILYVVENIKVDGGYTPRRMGHAINIKGNVFAMPFHFIYLMDEMTKKPGYNGATVVMVTSTKSIRISLPMEDFMHSFMTTDISADMDICMIKIEKANRNSVGVLNFLLTDDDIIKLKRYNTFDACVAGSSFSDLYRNELLLRSCKVKAMFSSDTIVKSKWSQTHPYYSIKESVKYSSPFSAGDCGSIIYVENTTFNNRSILGFHIAGDESNGFSTILTKENMESMLHELKFAEDCPFVTELEPIEYEPYTTIESQGSMQPIGKLFPRYAPSEFTKSEITKSVLHSKLPAPYDIVKTLPCKLGPFNHDGKTIDPGRIALGAYGCDPGCYPRELLDDAVKSYESLINNYTDTSREGKTILSIEEALGSFGNLKPIASATSAGYPMNLPTVENLKVKYFDAVYREDEVARKDVLMRIALEVTAVTVLYLDRIRPNWFFKDSLKDEKKKRDKVLQGKTRMFSGSPFILLIEFRRYFGSFMDMYFKHNINIGSAIGVNPYSEHWNALARFMLKFADNRDDKIAGAGDYKGFDCHEQPEIMYAILDIIQRWYGYSDKEATHIRNCLWAEIVNSKHIFRGEVYEWHSSMPSGNPMTAVINTMYNNIIFRMSYGLLDCDVKNFNKEVYVCCLGDDNIFTVCRNNRSKFNEMTLPGAMIKLGMIYTTELKEEALIPFRSLDEIEFLKRSFIFNKTYNRWIAPLREESIVEMLDWSKKGSLRDQITADNIIGAVREFAIHGEEKFKHWSVVLRDLKEKYLPGVHPSGEISWEYTKALKDALGIDFEF